MTVRASPNKIFVKTRKVYTLLDAVARVGSIQSGVVALGRGLC